MNTTQARQSPEEAPEVAYDRFIADVYDHSPFFGQGRTREMERFNAPYFQHLADRPGRLLEFGSGTGMLTIPLARAGYELDSLDISPYMHEVLGRKLAHEDPQVMRRIRQIVADATTWTGPQPYGSIVMPEGILIALPDFDLQMALLRNCHRNLAPGGRIYTDCFQPFYKAIYHETLTEYSRFRTPDDARYLLTMEVTNDKHSQVQHWKATFTRVEHGEKRDSVVVHLDFRYVLYSELRLMLQATGFRVIDIDVDFVDGRGFFVIAEKA